MDTDDTEGLPGLDPTIPDAPTPDAPPLPRTAVDWGRCIVTPGLVSAMGRAQAAAQTVGKGGRNADKGYDYATGDSMLAELRRCLAEANAAKDGGTLWVTFAHRAVDSGRGEPAKDAGQWVDALIVTECVVLHVDDAGVVGQWVATAECESVCSKARPADKAARAAETYRAGFIARDLLCLDRGKVAAAEDVDQRGDDGTAVQGRRWAAAKPNAAEASAESELRDACAAKIRALQESRVAAGNPRPSPAGLMAELMGDGWKPVGVAGYTELSERLTTAVAEQHKAATSKGRKRQQSGELDRADGTGGE